MIDNEAYKQLLEKGLSLDHFFLLCNMKNGTELAQTKRIQGFINLLTKKGYITQEGDLSETGIDLVENCNYVAPKISPKAQETDKWIDGLFTRLQEKMVELTGKKQITTKIEGTSYSFFPNKVDFKKTLTKVLILYKVKDLDKVEATLMKYIEQKQTEGKWFPILQYYIMKNNVSRLVTDLDNDEPAQEQFTSTQKFV